jgi:hypothetical protein
MSGEDPTDGTNARYVLDATLMKSVLHCHSTVFAKIAKLSKLLASLQNPHFHLWLGSVKGFHRASMAVAPFHTVQPLL